METMQCQGWRQTLLILYQTHTGPVCPRASGRRSGSLVGRPAGSGRAYGEKVGRIAKACSVSRDLGLLTRLRRATHSTA